MRPVSLYRPPSSCRRHADREDREYATAWGERDRGGATLEAAAALAVDHGREQRLTFIHPYDDPLIIAGQGTIAPEMLTAVPDLDVLIVPIGGGGLISGMAVAAKTLKPEIEIVGVQAALYPSMYNLRQRAHAPHARRHAGGGHCGQEPPAGLLPRSCGGAGRRHRAGEQNSTSSMRRACCSRSRSRSRKAPGLPAWRRCWPIRNASRAAWVGLAPSGGNIDTRLLSGVLTRQLACEGRLPQLPPVRTSWTGQASGPRSSRS